MIVKILGGHHSGEVYNIDSDNNHIQLLEYSSPVISQNTFQQITNSTVATHRYRRLEFKYIKHYMSDGCTERWNELEFNNIFIPAESTPEYERTLKEVFSSLLSAEFKHKQREV